MTSPGPSKPSLEPEVLSLLEFQETSWTNGEPVSTEELLRTHPSVKTVPGAVLELLYNEAILRERHGQPVEIAEFQKRFPDFAAEFELQWQIDQALVATPTELATPDDEGAKDSAPGIPARIGRYQIDRIIGTGGMGVVYLARDSLLDRNLALKMLRCRLPTELAVHRFRSEATAIAKLSHPHLVQIFDIGEHEGTPYYAMELCTGGTLAERLKNGPLPPSQAVQILVQVGQGVTAAHEKGVLHRDLKPANILFSTISDPIAKVADFGLAKDLTQDGHLTESGAILGTPNYMPPEQAFGDTKALLPAADVYSLGAILYECLTGRTPFQGASIHETLNQVREQEPVPVRRLQPSVPRDLETIGLKCLQKEPARRYQSVSALVDDLVRFQDGKPILARPTGSLERGWRWARRNRLAATLGIGVLLAIGIAAIGGSILSVLLAGALRDAKRDRDRANDSERQTREHLVESYAAAARLALQRGNGRVALQNLDDAEHSGLHTPALQLMRVKALCTIHDVPRAVEEVRTLAARDDLAELAGEVQLWKADLELDSQSIDLALGLEQIRDAMTRGLSSADEHYARGLLAKTIPEAIVHLHQAVQADPTNPRSNTLLAMLLVFSGQFAEARERLVAADVLFPDHPVFVVIRATLDAVQDKPDAVHQQLKKLRQQLGEASYRLAEGTVRYCQELTDFVRQLEKLQCGEVGVSVFSVSMTLQRSLSKIHGITASGSSDLYLPFPPGLLAEFRTRVRAISSSSSFPLSLNSQDLATAFEKLADFQPDAFFLLFAGTQQAKGGTIEDWRKASALLTRSTQCGSMLPVRRMCLYGAAVAESTLYRDAPKSEAPTHRTNAIAFITRLVDVGMTAQQAFKIAERCEQLEVPPEIAWRVLAGWQAADKSDPRLTLARAKVLLRMRDYESVIRLADEQLKPGDNAVWSELRKQALAQWERRPPATDPTR